MGAYLSRPLTAKESSDAASERLQCGASCMQGWRVMQEDAHNQILDYDADSSLFAVYDGHGGAEVAKYCAQKLPQFIKDTEAYKNGDFVQALEDAFLGFDATIAEQEVVQLLKTLAGPENSAGEEGSDEEENVHNLCEEASMPLDEVMAKYQSKAPNSLLSNFISKNEANNPASPNLRSKRAGTSSDGASSSSSKCAIDGVSSSTSSSHEAEEKEPCVSTSNGHHSLPESPTEISSTNECETSTSSAAKKSTDVDKPNDNEASKDSSEVATTDSCEISQSEKQDEPKNDTNHTESNNEKSDASSSEATSEIKSDSPKCSGSGESSSKSNAERSVELAKIIKSCAPVFYTDLLGMMMNNDGDDSDSNDETFEGKEYASSSDEENTVNGVNGDSSDDDGEEDSSEHTEIEEEEDMDEFSLNIKNEPGSSSGCTAVVALLQNNTLYVANAGDSRCVVCRDGQAIDMSIDHKPEDKIELDRITKAGGKVSEDGRVNGGLNLSRAIGDLGYKQNKELGPKEQMITALPDVKTLTINPETDSFMVLACDGIWNFMSSQNVVDFISERLAEGRDKLSRICEEMFDHCLAPNTCGDGTGCDNMTAVIIKFNPLTKNVSETITVKKRQCEVDDAEQEAQAKRLKSDDDSVAVTSSV